VANPGRTKMFDTTCSPSLSMRSHFDNVTRPERQPPQRGHFVRPELAQGEHIHLAVESLFDPQKPNKSQHSARILTPDS
jgi:hypothetical protein